MSLALHDSPMISSKTRRLVREAMKESGYVHNVAVASLRTGRSRIVGVSFHNIAHQFFAELFIAIEDRLGAAGIAVFLNNHGEDPSRLARFVDSVSAYGAEALIVSPPPHVTAEILTPVRERGMPIVYVSRHIEGDDAADRVVNADTMAMAARRATGRLLELGHRRLVLVGGQPGTTVSEGRVAGFRAEIENAGLAWWDDIWVKCRPRLSEGAEAARTALAMPDRPTGFICFNDLVAFGTMNALRTRGLEPGRDVGVVGIGGTDEAMAPGLTTVLDHPANIGAIAAETLLKRLSDPQGPPRHVTLEPKLVIRESCGGPIG